MPVDGDAIRRCRRTFIASVSMSDMHRTFAHVAGPPIKCERQANQLDRSGRFLVGAQGKTMSRIGNAQPTKIKASQSV
jgi:hypothetical protein